MLAALPRSARAELLATVTTPVLLLIANAPPGLTVSD
jgi:hypothetical protein